MTMRSSNTSTTRSRPSYTLPDKPTNDDLTALDPDDIDVDDAPNHSQLSPDELAVAFATYTTTWDSAPTTSNAAMPSSAHNPS